MPRYSTQKTKKNYGISTVVYRRIEKLFEWRVASNLGCTLEKKGNDGAESCNCSVELEHVKSLKQSCFSEEGHLLPAKIIVYKNM